MKLQRRELNVFSMSALDLFASGMGAFVLLAITAMPFFPNTGDSKERVEDLKGQLESAESRSEDLENLVAKLHESNSIEEALSEELTETLRQIEDMKNNIQDLENQLAQSVSASREQELEQQLASALKALQDAETQVQTLQTTQSELLIPHLDIVICLDVTGSMLYQIDGLKREISSLAELLDRISPSVGIGIVAFGDRKWQRPMYEMDIIKTTSMGRIQSFVNRLTPNMQDPGANLNDDSPEAVTTALQRAIAMSWRSQSERRYIIVITDNAAYPERESDALTAARRFASQNHQFVSAVRANLGYSAPDRIAAFRFLRALAQAGEGNFVDAAGGESILSSVLLAILGT